MDWRACEEVNCRSPIPTSTRNSIVDLPHRVGIHGLSGHEQKTEYLENVIGIFQVVPEKKRRSHAMFVRCVIVVQLLLRDSCLMYSFSTLLAPRSHILKDERICIYKRISSRREHG
jgi:hypothetical protein